MTKMEMMRFKNAVKKQLKTKRPSVKIVHYSLDKKVEKNNSFLKPYYLDGSYGL